MKLLPLLALFLLALLSPPSAAEVVQIQIIHRHGARPPLSKDPITTAEEDRPNQLYPEGVNQLTALGKYVRSTYLESSSSLHIKGIARDTIRRGDVMARSSNLYRTMISSNAFFAALYPDNLATLVPTLVFNNTMSDWLIRGYAVCPALDDRFEQFVDSDKFKDMRDQIPENHDDSNNDFVRRLASNFKGRRDDKDREFSLADVWNVYDRYLVIHREGYGSSSWLDDSPPLKDVDKLSEGDFDRLRQLADWYETSKYDFATHKIHVAGRLLQKIMVTARHAIEPRRRRPEHKLVEYSAHYPTLLSLLASMRWKNDETTEFPADKIPGFGSALIFELHKDDNEYFMRLKWWQGDGKAGMTEADIDFKEFAIGRQPCTDPSEGCKFSDLERLLATVDMGKDAFCDQCESKNSVCVNRTSGAKLAAGFIGAAAGLVLGLMLALGYFTISARRKRRGLGLVDNGFDSEGAFEGEVNP